MTYQGEIRRTFLTNKEKRKDNPSPLFLTGLLFGIHHLCGDRPFDDRPRSQTPLQPNHRRRYCHPNPHTFLKDHIHLDVDKRLQSPVKEYRVGNVVRGMTRNEVTEFPTSRTKGKGVDGGHQKQTPKEVEHLISGLSDGNDIVVRLGLLLCRKN